MAYFLITMLVLMKPLRGLKSINPGCVSRLASDNLNHSGHRTCSIDETPPVFMAYFLITMLVLMKPLRGLKSINPGCVSRLGSDNLNHSGHRTCSIDETPPGFMAYFLITMLVLMKPLRGLKSINPGCVSRLGSKSFQTPMCSKILEHRRCSINTSIRQSKSFRTPEVFHQFQAPNLQQ